MLVIYWSFLSKQSLVMTSFTCIGFIMFNQSKLLMRPSYTTNDNGQKSYNAEGVMKKEKEKWNIVITQYTDTLYTNIQILLIVIL